ncbi:T9SS type B sorting domain-containing protein [Aurantibacter sp.]|uniref:T9SS type B sorting domain-containing protein n=1 Tax=Aurantibacter sp. TaxID=2807103 RepID=UPI0035C7FBCC
MKTNAFFIITFTLITLNLTAQRQAANWYFGDKAGINFDINNTVTPLNNGELSTIEGCTSISSEAGNLLFYTDGKIVYNSSHDIMSNGSGLLGDSSSSQSALIVPKPEDPNIYYIFTVGASSSVLGLNYSVVDMTLDFGLGAITTKNVNLLTACAEKVSAVLKDCESGNIWVAAFSNDQGNSTVNMNSFHAYEISSIGINLTPVISTFNSLAISELRGNMKFSPNGENLALANINSGLYLFDFDVSNGIFSNANELIRPNLNSASNEKSYGVEFSPNNSLLYTATYNDYFTGSASDNNSSNHYSKLLQFNLTSTNIPASKQTIDDRNLYRSSLQLGPDGKIYRSMSGSYTIGSPYLSVINNPNLLGINCNYVHQQIQLSSNSRQGLPPFIASFFSEKIDIIPTDNTNTVNLPLCIGENYTLIADDIPGAVYTWSKDGVTLSDSDYDLVVNQSGVYDLLIELSSGDCSSLEGQAIVTYYDIPTATTPTNYFVCDDNDDSLYDFDLTTKDSEILNGQDNTVYEVKYYNSDIDLNDYQNEISGLYTNTSVPETIYARVQNIGNPNCFDYISFEIGVYDSPEINSISNFEVCDDSSDSDDANGQTTINLNNFNSEILGTQNSTEFTITYHLTQSDADSKTSPLPNNYYNTTPFNQQLFIRLENNLNTSCYTTEQFNITINPIPTAQDVTIKQCDEDGVSDGLTQFNLTEAYNSITNNSTTSTIAFYSSQTDANSEANEIDGANYINSIPNETIYVVVTEPSTGCKKQSQLILEISNSQITDYNPPAECDELGSEDGINTFNLENFSTIILSGLPSNVTISYYETLEDATLETNVLSSPYNNTTPYNQTLYARAESNNDCFGINEIQLTIHPRPNIGIDETQYYCLNDFPITQELSTGLIGNPTDYSFIWNTSEITESIEIDSVGVYTVTVSNNYTGCQKTREFNVEASNIATIEQPIYISDGNLFNNVVEVTATGEGIYLYALENQDGELIGYQNSGLFYYIPAGIYTVLVKDIKADCGTAQVDISVIGFPQFFTPNGDQYHEYWQVYGVNEVFQAKSDIYIYDRYGKLLAKIDPTGLGWDGTYNGLPMPTNDYWFSVKLEDGRVYRNNFTLKR